MRVCERLPPACALMGIEPTTWACVPIRNLTSNLSMYRTMPNPMGNTSQDYPAPFGFCISGCLSISFSGSSHLHSSHMTGFLSFSPWPSSFSPSAVLHNTLHLNIFFATICKLHIPCELSIVYLADTFGYFGTPSKLTEPIIFSTCPQSPVTHQLPGLSVSVNGTFFHLVMPPTQ